MKRRDFVKLFERNGWWLEREGGNHSVYTNGSQKEQIPRHGEIKETLAKSIIKRRGLQ